MNFKKGLVSILILTMVLTGIPIIPIQDGVNTVYAGGKDYNVFDALGFDIEDDLGNDNSNPYGKGITEIMPVSELYLSRGANKFLLGHDKPVFDLNNYTEYDVPDKYSGIDTSGITIDSGNNLKAFSAFSGDFNGDGLDAEIAVVGAGTDVDATNPKGIITDFKLFFDGYDTATNKAVNSNTMKDLKTDKFFGLRNSNSSFEYNGGMVYNYLKIATGDVTGDDIDEVIVYVPEEGESRIEVYQIKKGMEEDWSNTENWVLLYTQGIARDDLVPNRVALLSDDFNRDGIDDIAVAYGVISYDKSNENDDKTSKVKLLLGSKDEDDRFNIINLDTDDMYNVGIGFGDVDGDRQGEIILSGHSPQDNYYIDEVHEFRTFKGDFVLAFSESRYIKNNNLTRDTMWYPITVAAIRRKGAGTPASIWIDGSIVTYELEEDEDDKPYRVMKVHNINCYNSSFIDLVTGDINGDGNYEVVLRDAGHTYDPKYIMSYTYIYKIKEGSGFADLDKYTDHRKGFLFDSDCDGQYEQIAYIADDTTDRRGNDYTVICATDIDTVTMKYVGKQIIYSDPKVLAVIASPPYFKDLEHLDGGDNYMNCETTYGTSEGSGSGELETETISAGGYVSYEAEFSFFGFSAAKFEAETEFGANWTTDTEKTLSETQSIEYTTEAGQDTVAMYSIPLEVYTYELTFQEGSGSNTKWTTQQSTVTIPRNPVIKTYTLQDYDAIAKYYSVLPVIGDNIFKHEVGVPSSYPSSTAGYKNAVVPDGAYIGVGYGSGSSITQSVEITEENSETHILTGYISAKVGGGAGGVTAGVTAGYESGSGTCTTDMTGTMFSTTIVNMPMQAKDYDYGYSLKMFQYNKDYYKWVEKEKTFFGITFKVKEKEKYTIPVVSYAVTDISQPPRLPDDFSYEVTETTNNKVTLTWTDNLESDVDSVVGYQLYKQYEFPEGVSDYPLAFVDINAKNDEGLYKYVDSNLLGDTNYNYRIQVIDSSIPNKSVKSDLLTVKTRMSEGLPTITLIGVGDDNRLTVHPDVKSEVIANVTNDTQASKPNYIWQRFKDGEWTEVGSEAEGNKLVFENSQTEVNGKYRLKVNQFIGTNGVSVYSDEFVVELEKRYIENTSVKNTDYTDGVAIIEVELTVNSDSSLEDEKLVVDLSKDDFKRRIIGTIVKTTNKNYIEIEEKLPEGLYNLDIYYPGNSIYKSYVGIDRCLVSSSDNYYYSLDLPNVVYGEDIDKYKMIVEYTKDSAEKVYQDSTLNDGYTLEEAYYKLSDLDTKIEKPKNVGDYRYKVVVKKGTTGTVVAELSKDFSITKKKLSIMPDNIENNQDDSELPTWTELGMQSSGLEYDDSLDMLGLEMLCLTLDGQVVSAFNNSEKPNPGRYVFRVKSKESGVSQEDKISRSNYEITFKDSIYTVIGATYSLELETVQIEGKDYGEIEMISPDTNKTSFQQNTPITIVATPHTGYEVVLWESSEGSGSYTKVDPLNENPNMYMLNMPADNTRVRVTFALKELNLNFKATDVDTTEINTVGTVQCTNIPNLKSGDIVVQGATYDFKAIPNTGYHFKKWVLKSQTTSSTPIGEVDDDGNHILSVDVDNEDITLEACFERDSYSLELAKNLIAYKKTIVEGGEDIYVKLTDLTSIKGDTLVAIKPRNGNEVIKGVDGNYSWESSVDGEIIGDDGQEYTFKILENTSVSATLQAEQLNGTVTIDGFHKDDVDIKLYIDGELTPFDGVEFVFESGSDLVIDFIEGYGIKDVEKVVAIGQTVDLAINASFVEEDNYLIDLTNKNNSLHGSVKATIEGHEDVQAVDNKLKVYKGDKVEIKATPEQGYMVGYWTIDDDRKEDRVNRKTFDITGDIKIEIEFMPLVYYKLEYSNESNGTLTVIKDDDLAVESGSNVGGGSKITFDAVPNDGYMVEGWYEILANSSETEIKYEYEHAVNGNKPMVKLVDKQYVIEGIGNNRNVKVKFTPIVKHQTSFTGEYMTFNVEVTPDEYNINGEYKNSFTGELRDEAIIRLSLLPDSGYRVVKVNVDGDEQEYTQEEEFVVYAEAEDVNHTYIFENKRLYSINTTQPSRVNIDKTIAVEGETIKINTSIPSAHEFKGWEIKNETDGTTVTPLGQGLSTEFVMPEGNVVVKAIFNYIGDVNNGGDDNPTPNPTPGPSGGGSSRPKKDEEEPADTAAAIDKAIKDAKKVNGVKKVTIEVEEGKDGEILATLPNGFNSRNKVELTLETKDIDITLSNDTFTGEEKSIEVKINKVDKSKLNLSEEAKEQLGNLPVYDISLIIDKKNRPWRSSKSIDIAIDVNKKIPEEEKHKYVAAYIDENNNVILLKSSLYIDGAVRFDTNHLSHYAVMYINKVFSDMEGYEWANTAVEALASRGIINGTSKTTFAPGNKITRADFISLLVRYFEFKGEAIDNFTDVPEDMYYTNNVGLAKAYGIVSGGEDGKFRPLDSVTRQDMMVMLHRAMVMTGDYKKMPTLDKDISTYNDKMDVGPYAVDSVNFMIKSGLISGSNNMINPARETTRAEVAVMLYNMLKAMK